MAIYNREDPRTALPQLEKQLQSEIDKVQEDVDSLKADYVVEQGSSGIWTYRKWASGIAECWGRTPVTTYSCVTQSGNLWYNSDTFYFPTGLFTQVDVGFSNRAQGVGGTPYNTLVTVSGRGLSETEFGVWIYTPQSTSQSLSISLYAKGKWK